MKTQFIRVLAALTLCAGLQQAAAQGTAFTYQGQLSNGTNPVTGLYNFKFDTFNASTGGSVIGAAITNTAVPVTNGLFATIIDFGANVFTGPTNWLHVQVTTNGGTNFISLAPRQELTPTPYAIYAESASNLLGTLPVAQLSGTVPLAQLPGTVVTNNESSSVTLSNVTVSGILNLPATATIDAGGNSLLFYDANNNFYAGPGAGSPTNSGSANTGIGSQSLGSNSNGTNNTALGYASLGNNTNGSYNIAIGERTLLNNASGNDNTAVGRHALENNTVGNGNTADGYGALSGDQVGSFNIALGYLAGSAYNSNASNNIDIGNTGTAGENYTIHIGDPNTHTNTFIAGVINGNGGGLTSLNASQLTSGTVPLAQLPPTVGLLSDAGSANFFAGLLAGNPSVSGYRNTGVGGGALGADTSGFENTANGYDALNSDKAGADNTASGAYALGDSTSGSENTAVGAAALGADSTGSNNVAIGYEAIQNNSTDNGLVAVGFQALQNDASGSGLFTIGGANTAIGYQALQRNTGGDDNTGIGYQSLMANTSGNDNTAIGVWSLIACTGYENIAIGSLAGYSLTTGANNIDIGNPGASGDNGIIRIGIPGTQTSTYLAGNVALNGGLNIDQNGTYGSNTGTVISNALTFGTGPGGSGEGIASQRTSGPNQFDLTLFTGFNPRLTVLSSGYVGIGLTNPSSLLEVNGNERVDGGSLYLEGSGGNNQYDGLTWGTPGLPGINEGEGPFLAGYYGGALGSTGPNSTSLTWDYTGDVWVSNNCSVATLTIRGGSDLAEPFNITTGNQEVPEGAVVVIDDQNPGQLKLSDSPYDTHVAGVVSGANGIHPGIQMHQQGLLEGGKNVALTGRVYVQADASNGAIRPGDMLTTSRTPGHAMKVTDHARAEGAILGKAMTGLSQGQGMVLVLVTLQ